MNAQAEYVLSRVDSLINWKKKDKSCGKKSHLTYFLLTLFFISWVLVILVAITILFGESVSIPTGEVVDAFMAANPVNRGFAAGALQNLGGAEVQRFAAENVRFGFTLIQNSTASVSMNGAGVLLSRLTFNQRVFLGIVAEYHTEVAVVETYGTAYYMAQRQLYTTGPVTDEMYQRWATDAREQTSHAYDSTPLNGGVRGAVRNLRGFMPIGNEIGALPATRPPEFNFVPGNRILPEVVAGLAGRSTNDTLRYILEHPIPARHTILDRLASPMIRRIFFLAVTRNDPNHSGTE